MCSGVLSPLRLSTQSMSSDEYFDGEDDFDAGALSLMQSRQCIPPPPRTIRIPSQFKDYTIWKSQLMPVTGLGYQRNKESTEGNAASRRTLARASSNNQTLPVVDEQCPTRHAAYHHPKKHLRSTRPQDQEMGSYPIHEMTTEIEGQRQSSCG